MRCISELKSTIDFLLGFCGLMMMSTITIFCCKHVLYCLFYIFTFLFFIITYKSIYRSMFNATSNMFSPGCFIFVSLFFFEIISGVHQISVGPEVCNRYAWILRYILIVAVLLPPLFFPLFEDFLVFNSIDHSLILRIECQVCLAS